MQYVKQIFNNVIVNMYLIESNIQDVRSKFSKVNNGLQVKSGWQKPC